ncbi:MAG: alpha-mannosidase [Propionibacteriales bacterium]|nr:alpha-mannosidase [Propionibacteriales bacterium]
MTADDVVYLVPHTHWDREWYEPFQRFRLRLVRLVDEVLDRAEAEPGFRFTMDGQMAAVDDYLEVRPDNRERVAALVRQGRLAVGPWQILLDEFLCSGENIVRNLETGWLAAEALGAVMPVGYLPDMFGHCAQMPQILARAGLRHACIWRGVPATVETHAFRWRAPDGSSVRTEYLPGGYGNGVALFAQPDRLGEAVAGHRDRALTWFGDDPVLAMFGTDHSTPLPGLMGLVRGLDEDGSPVRLSVITLADYIAGRDADAGDLVDVTGELRSHARANVLPGVISVRGQLKQAMAAAERMVERYAEPMAALWSQADVGRFLELAWRRLVDCSCHDSVTGCGVDETAVQVAARIAEAEQLGQAVRDQVLGELAAEVPADGHVVVNPSPFERTGLVELDLAAGEHAPRSLQVAGAGPVPMQETGRPPTAPWEGRVDADEPRRRVLAAVTVPPLGTVSVVPAVATAEVGAPVEVVGARGIANDRVQVEVDTAGTLTVRSTDGTVLTGVGRLVDGGDRGDSYNWGRPSHDRLVDEPSEVAVDVLERGPLRAVLAVVRVYRWPVGLDAADHDHRSGTLAEVSVRTLVELRAGEPYVRLAVSFRNPSANHRLRLHVPLPVPADHSAAEGQFAVTRRGLTAESGHGEDPVPTFPASSFVSAGGAHVLLDQVTEYELVDGGRELALTLLRSVGMLSVDVHPGREEPAGPQLPVPAAQRVGQVVEARLAVLAHAGDWSAADALVAAEAFRHDLVATAGTRLDAPAAVGVPDPRTGLSVRGDGVVMTSLRRRGGGQELRLVAMTDQATVARIDGDFGAVGRVDLLGRPLEEPSTGAAGTLELPLGPWEIATVQLHP